MHTPYIQCLVSFISVLKYLFYNNDKIEVMHSENYVRSIQLWTLPTLCITISFFSKNCVL